MTYKHNRVRVGTMMHPDIIELCDENIKKSNAQSRNDFIEEAVIFYVGHLNDKDNRYLSQSIQSVIQNNIQLTENRISKLMFKLAVELSITMNVVAAMKNIDNETLEKLREKCIKDVRKSIGQINYEAINDFQNRED